MPLVADIRTVLSKVARAFANGVISYRSLTSAPDARPRTYTVWADVPYARTIEYREEQVRDDKGVWWRQETCELRVPYEAGVILTVRDQVREGTTAGASPDNPVWSIDAILDAADDAVRTYRLMRRTPMLQNARQGGGV